MPASLLARLFLLCLALGAVPCWADSAYEQSRLALMLRQLDTLELLIDQVESAGSRSPQERYRFDYPRLRQDIQRLRGGIQGYLSPSRAQPRDPSELLGEYRREAVVPERAP